MRPATGVAPPPTTPQRSPSRSEAEGAAHEPDRVRENFSRILGNIPGGPTLAVTASAPPAYGDRAFAERPDLSTRWFSAPGQVGSEGPVDPATTFGPAAFGTAVFGGGQEQPPQPDEQQRVGSPADAEAPRPHWQAVGFADPAASKAVGKAPPTSSPGPVTVWSMFPEFFSFCGFLLFLGPTWVVVHLSHDGDVVYWMGPWCELAELLPLVFIVAFVVHAKLRRPHKPTVLLCLLVPAAILLVLSDVLTSTAADNANRLISTDCDTFAGKRSLERSWQAAQRLFETCLEDTVKSRSDITMERARSLFRIQDCEEYAQSLAQHERDWEYLAELEEEHRCGGWCQAGAPLWTLAEVRDSCSAAVSQVLGRKVTRAGKQVTFVSVVVLVLTTLGNLLFGPALRASGMQW